MPGALRVLTGKRAKRGEPAAVTGEPTMPADLSREERAAWRQLIRELQTVPGLLARADRGVLELAARMTPMFREAARHVRENGSTLVARDERGAVKFVQTTPQGQMVVKLGASLKTIFAELGLTPSGRSRLSVSAASGPSRLDAFRGGRHGA
jgi:P27 family predicted phage terminase small subunit